MYADGELNVTGISFMGGHGDHIAEQISIHITGSRVFIDAAAGKTARIQHGLRRLCVKIFRVRKGNRIRKHLLARLCLRLLFLCRDGLLGELINRSQDPACDQGDRKQNGSVLQHTSDHTVLIFCVQSVIHGFPVFRIAHARSPPFPKAFGRVTRSIRGTRILPRMIA